jgi:hypothetical protein
MADAGERARQFAELVPLIIVDAGEYAGSGQQDPDTENVIRKLQVLTQALTGALSAIRVSGSA